MACRGDRFTVITGGRIKKISGRIRNGYDKCSRGNGRTFRGACGYDKAYCLIKKHCERRETRRILSVYRYNTELEIEKFF